MGFDSVKISHFRNLEEQTVDISSREIYLVGENGQGKTNFLELLYFLCYGSSFRNKNDKMLIKEGEDSFHLSGRFKHSDDFISSRVDVHLDDKGKKIRLNGKSVSDRKDILAHMPCIVFCHNDLYFVNGNPEKKRIYLDQCLSLHDPLYINDLRDYRKILRERNFLLKQGEKSPLLTVYSQQLVDKGLVLQKKREGLIQFLNDFFPDYYKRVSDTDLNLSIVYKRSWKEDDRDYILNSLNSRRDRELRYGLTMSGPHRDSFSVVQEEGRDFIDMASTGQLRIISLIMRILQSEFYQQSTGKDPVFLVDDVLLELDPGKRERMMSLFPRYEQIFYTFLPGFIGEKRGDAMYYDVIDGKLEKSNGKS